MDAETLFKQAIAQQEAGDLGAAAGTFRLLVSVASDARYHIAFGYCLLLLRHWKESVAQLQRGLELRPKYGEADARLLLAKALKESGLARQACAQLQHLLALEPSYPSYREVHLEADALLKELRS